jgi:hypothetical protein
VREALRRAPLERIVHVAVAATIVAVAFGSNWSPSVRHVAQPLWRAALVALAALAVAYAWSRRGRLEVERLRVVPFALAAGVVLVASASAGWSVDAKLTAARALSFGLLLTVAAALGYATAGDPPAARRLALAVLAGACAVGLLGLAVWVLYPGDAFQEATPNAPARFRGVGQNANTVSMLFAAALPLVAWIAIESRGRLRVAALAAGALLYGSIVGSGSRGAFATAFLGVLFVTVLLARTRRARLALAAGVAALLVAGLGLSRLPDTLPPERAGQSPSASSILTGSPNDAEASFRLEDELGNPGHAVYVRPHARGLVGASGREQAWRGALEQGADRPLLGYGFGTEDRVFVDRFYSFFGGVPENSYIGAFLQIGLIGDLLLVALLVALAVPLLLSLRKRATGAVVACTAVLLVGVVLASVQSYLYAAGNNATLTVWLCGFLGLGALATAEDA